MIEAKDIRRVLAIKGQGTYVSHEEYLMHENQVQTFIAAQERLHYSPGRNPYNGVRTLPLLSIEVFELDGTYGYWWTSPTLDETGQAQILDWRVVLEKNYTKATE